MQVIGYVRVSTENKPTAARGSRPSAPRSSRVHAARLAARPGDRGRRLLGQGPAPAGVQAALRCSKRGARALVVAKLDRLSRSMLDFTGVMARRRNRLGAGRARLRRRHDDAGGRGDGARPGHLRAVRAAADRAADEGSARRQEGAGRAPRTPAHDAGERAAANRARARSGKACPRSPRGSTLGGADGARWRALVGEHRSHGTCDSLNEV